MIRSLGMIPEPWITGDVVVTVPVVGLFRVGY